MAISKKVWVIAGVVAGAAVLVGGGYAAGKVFAHKKNSRDFITLEDGRRMRLENRNGFANQERPNITGRIKSISDGQLVVEKFAMPTDIQRGERQNSTGNWRAGESDQGNRQGGGGAGPQGDTGTRTGNRPQLQIEGEETITFADNIEILKNNHSFGRGPMAGGDNEESEPQKISASDLREGDMVSIWLTDGDNSKVAEKIMVRGASNN